MPIDCNGMAPISAPWLDFASVFVLQAQNGIFLTCVKKPGQRKEGMRN